MADYRDPNDPTLRRDDTLMGTDAKRGAARRDDDLAADRKDVGVDGNAVGGTSGLVAGAAIGAATGGPVGAVIGAAAGALTGVGVAKGVDAAVNPEEEDRYWSENYSTRPYAAADRGYDHYRPAYQYGWEARARHGNRSYDEVEPELASGWDQYRTRSSSSLGWDDAKHATRDAWHRIERRIPGDADRDGR